MTKPTNIEMLYREKLADILHAADSCIPENEKTEGVTRLLDSLRRLLDRATSGKFCNKPLVEGFCGLPTDHHGDHKEILE